MSSKSTLDGVQSLPEQPLSIPITPARKNPASEWAGFPQDRKKERMPRLGFLGVGWTGRNRLEAIAQSGCVEIAGVTDPSPGMVEEARRMAPSAVAADSLEDLLALGLDGIVIATPSALHADQSITAMRHGCAVFCQKPLGRNAHETRNVVEAARSANLLLGVDLSYRFVSAMRSVHRLCIEGALGRVYAADLVFHNAYGPDKAWFYERAKSGGGCVIDLGIHLVDQALWNLGFPGVTRVTARTYSKGGSARDAVEDYCEARLDLETGATVRVACSWKLSAGCDAVIRGSFCGTEGGAAFSNVSGSFYDFIAERFEGTRKEVLYTGSEPWGGRAAVDWARRLSAQHRYDPEVEHVTKVAEVLDRIYAAAAESE